MKAFNIVAFFFIAIIIIQLAKADIMETQMFTTITLFFTVLLTMIVNIRHAKKLDQ